MSWDRSFDTSDDEQFPSRPWRKHNFKPKNKSISLGSDIHQSDDYDLAGGVNENSTPRSDSSRSTPSFSNDRPRSAQRQIFSQENEVSDELEVDPPRILDTDVAAKQVACDSRKSLNLRASATRLEDCVSPHPVFNDSATSTSTSCISLGHYNRSSSIEPFSDQGSASAMVIGSNCLSDDALDLDSGTSHEKERHQADHHQNSGNDLFSDLNEVSSSKDHEALADGIEKLGMQSEGDCMQSGSLEAGSEAWERRKNGMLGRVPRSEESYQERNDSSVDQTQRLLPRQTGLRNVAERLPEFSSEANTDEPHKRALLHDTHSGFVQSSSKVSELEAEGVYVKNDPPLGFRSDYKAQESSRNFAMEHRIFIRAALELLSQKDRFATEIVMSDSDTIKSGPLRKAKHLVRGVWKVKYVEIRRGIFSYYEDAVAKDTEQGELVRKNIPLHAGSYTCRPVKVHHEALKLVSGGAIFELSVESGAKRLWMANSREERQSWIQAIQDATIGGSVIRASRQTSHGGKSGLVSSRSPYKKDLETYLKVQRAIKHAAGKEAYIGAISKLLENPINVPVQWIMKHIGTISSENAERAFHEEGVASGVNQLWKDLLRDSVCINGEVFIGGSGHAPEKIIAALMNDILTFDRSSPLTANCSETDRHRFLISESQAISYARDVLLCGNRTRSGGDSYFCVSTLCSNPSLVVMVPSSTEAEPLSVTVTHVLHGARGIDRSGWLRTRSRPQKAWKRRYFVLSQGSLSYYEQALPRPHGLRGQIALVETNLTVVKSTERSSKDTKQKTSKSSPDQFIISVFGRDGFVDRQILFESQDKFIPWAHSLETASRDEKDRKATNSNNTGKVMFRKLNLREEGVSPQTRSVFGPPLGGYTTLLGLDRAEIDRRLKTLTSSYSSGRPTVNISVKAMTIYRVCTVDPQGIDTEDTWATIQATFLQDFEVSGGPNGRIFKGEEIVRVSILEFPIITPVAKRMPGEPRSVPLRISAERIGRRLRRGSSNEESPHAPKVAPRNRTAEGTVLSTSNAN